MQASVALVILAAPVMCVEPFALSLPLAALGLYEPGDSVYTNFRVGLLLVYPALFAALLSWSALIFAALLRR